MEKEANMHSIRTKFTLLTVCAIVVALGIATLIAVVAIRNLGSEDADETLMLMCRTGEMNLDSYFEDVERSVKTVTMLVQESLEGVEYDQLGDQVERARNLFGKVAYETNGVLTYYFRLDPEVSKTEKGFWYLNLDGNGFVEHEPTDITQYDTNDTSQLVWFTVPKATGEGVWLPPYFTDSLDEVFVISYNAPVYWNDEFIGVIGIEIDYKTLAREVENIKLYDTGYAFVLDAEGNVIYHPNMDSATLAQQSMPDPPDGLMSDGPYVRYTYEGVEKEAVWLPLENGMRLYVTVPVSEITSSWQGLVRNILIASFVVLLIVSFFTMRFAGRLTKPLRQLTEAARQVDDGNYDFTLDYDENDEVGVLTRTFKQLATHVRDHIGELSKRANTDPLTSVRNKGAYGDFIQEIQDSLDASDEPIEFAIGVFDCDNLKKVNDQYGHAKGDLYLKAACRLICRTFQHSPVFRIGGDEFSVILRGEDYQNRNELLDQFRRAREEICENAENEWDQVSVTLGLAVYDPAVDAGVIDVARRADQLMYENKRIWKETLKEASQEGRWAQGSGQGAGDVRRPANIGQYILDHFDEALEHGDIKVYFQPVIRTLTRQVCGLEALARWQTDKYGILMPGEFIGVLEKRRRIHDLDIYVLRKVCESYNREKWRADVPISINLSRLDYELCDVFEVVESEVRANKVPRSSLCIEVTESVLASNDALMRQCIEKFRNAGYAVWIDDFGSGYSSLNVLKDSEFDELKIDMRFLSDFHARSKKILASIVHMAKEIGIHTLAEGVETEEQFAFLRNIGCEKVQGFLFAEAMPFRECLEHVANAGMTWEPPAMRRYYDDIGSLDVLSASPINEIDEQDEHITGGELNSISLAIVELRGDEAEMLYANDAFENIAAAVEWPLAWGSHDETSRIPLSRISQRLQKLLEEARTDGHGRLLSVYDNDYYEMSGFRLASCGDACAVLISVANLSQMSAMVAQQQLDVGLRSLYSVYEQVSLINLNDLTVVALHLDRDSGHKMPTGSLLARIEEYAERVFPDDRDRFRRFIDPDTMEERAAQEGGINIHLRVMSFHGSYDWKSFKLVRIEPNVYYLLIRSAESEMRELRSTYQVPEASDETITPELLWENVVSRYELKFFWKDRERRFVGASRSFLDHYAFESEAKIVGKTDEDMGWHIHNDPFRDEEWKVIHEGITSRKVEGNCLVQGEDREIVATKMPLFDRDGKIVGLIGSFYQTDSHASEQEAVLQARADDLTGLLNSRGLYENMFAYIDEYQLRGRDFARIEVGIDGFKDINERYGYDFGDAVIRETGRSLLRCCGNVATVGRVSGCVFTVLRQFDDSAELDDLVERIRQIPEGLREVNGVPFNMYLSVGMALYSETEDRDGMAAQAEMRRMTDDVEGISQHQLMENAGRIFHMFDELPLAYGVYKVISGSEGDDAIVIYANKKFMDRTQMTPETLIGARVSRFYAVNSNDWIKLAVQAGLEGKTVSSRYYFEPLGFEMEATAYPVIGPGFCAFTFRRVVS